MGAREVNTKSGLSLNLFDTILLLLVVAVGGFVIWYQLGVTSNTTSTNSYQIQYTILMNNMREGSGDLVREGSDVHDIIKKYHIGTVVSKETTPAVEQQLDQDGRIYRSASLPGKEDVYVVMEATAVDLGDEFIVDGGYTIRVGSAVYLHGEGYMAAGNVVAIDRSTVGG